MTVHFVGAGPGAADLLTVRATRLLAAADVVLYPGTYLDPDVLSHASPDAELVDTQGLDLDQITSRIVEAHAAGNEVVRLASGDLSIYSALAEQTRRLDAAGVAWDVTPGVPAYAAAAAVVGRELTVPLISQSVVLTRTQARSTAMQATENLAAFAATRATLVLHLAITKTRALMDDLIGDYGADCPVIVVYRASQPEQQILRGTVATIADIVDAARLKRAAVILVGWALDPTAGGESFLYDPARERGTKLRA
ncbi:precorrin-4 C(11)-methyltransferase [Gordonia sp. (in: high G+C Gram-positive bacteria)]|uniref:precorrin-4 C(11)-methyltransferase n=1 Tax=Gordonia sp. (in: high G+C Gram-positive bacteria) TaxID=84139 RepID=UPI003C762289